MVDYIWYFSPILNLPKDNPVLNNNVESFKDIKDFEGIYAASSLGYITNGRKALKTYTINSGYMCLKLYKNGIKKSVLLHRVIAETFLPNPHSKPEVNHIDGDKSNNAVSNLEWVTSSENKQHAFQTGLKIYNVPTKGIKLSKASKYHNVGYDKSRAKWFGVIRIDGKNYGQKRFDTEEEAALHVNYLLDLHSITDRPRNIV